MHVVGRARAWLPQRLLHFERVDVGAKIEEPARIHCVGRQHRDCRGVIEHHADGDAVLAVLRELGPVGGNPLVGIDQPPVDRHVEADAGHALGDAHHADGRVLVPLLAAVGPRPAAPQVDHRLAVDDHGAGSSELLLFAEVLGESFENGSKPLVANAAQRERGAACVHRLVEIEMRQAALPSPPSLCDSNERYC